MIPAVVGLLTNNKMGIQPRILLQVTYNGSRTNSSRNGFLTSNGWNFMSDLDLPLQITFIL